MRSNIFLVRNQSQLSTSSRTTRRPTSDRAVILAMEEIPAPLKNNNNEKGQLIVINDPPL